MSDGDTEFARENDDERLGCGDLLVAFAGMGCATLVRIFLLGLVVVIMYLVFHFLFHWV